MIKRKMENFFSQISFYHEIEKIIYLTHFKTAFQLKDAYINLCIKGPNQKCYLDKFFFIVNSLCNKTLCTLCTNYHNKLVIAYYCSFYSMFFMYFYFLLFLPPLLTHCFHPERPKLGG